MRTVVVAPDLAAFKAMAEAAIDRAYAADRPESLAGEDAVTLAQAQRVLDGQAPLPEFAAEAKARRLEPADLAAQVRDRAQGVYQRKLRRITAKLAVRAAPDIAAVNAVLDREGVKNAI
ncbi:hypothetical protein ACFQU1_20525 [Chelatococcus sp. GCM10030263]|uniref:hypothetical protein n=1 Tax=Chelatococcus sp. GCM10030263 TaxID=3273387 RepID=UPI00360AB72B